MEWFAYLNARMNRLLKFGGMLCALKPLGQNAAFNFGTGLSTEWK